MVSGIKKIKIIDFALKNLTNQEGKKIIVVDVLCHTCGVTVDPHMTDLEHECSEEDAHEGIAKGGEVAHVATCNYIVGPSMVPTLVDDNFSVVHASNQHPLVARLVGRLLSFGHRHMMPAWAMAIG